MVISYGSDGNVILKAKTETVVLGAGVRIGTHTIAGPGEYDVASIQCEGQALEHGVAYFIHTEDLFITFLTATDSAAAKLDGAEDTEILILDLRSDDTPEKAKALIKAFEPAYVFLIGAGSTPTLIAGLDTPVAPEDNLKVTKGSLPLEGTLLVTNR